MKIKKRWIIICSLAAASALLLSACSCPFSSGTKGKKEGAVSKITAEEGKALMDAGGVTVVDVRRADEYESGHVPGAINIPNEGIGDSRPEALPDLDAALIVYCRTGVRSAEAAAKLAALGYTDISDMGGIVDWPYDTVTGSEPGENSGKDVGGAEIQEPGLLSSFSTTDLEGSALDQSMLEDYELTMVNVWATFCGPCLREMPDLGELAEEYREKGVQIVGLVSDVLASDGSVSQEQVSLALDIVEKTGAAYPHLLPSQDLLGILSQIQFVPTTFFVDSQGRQVGSAYVRANTKAQWAEIIDETLEELEEVSTS